MLRDQHMRQHDPILGVVPLKFPDIHKPAIKLLDGTPMDSGIGFGRINISVLFRGIRKRLPSQQLGWDVGLFEFTSEKKLTTSYTRTPDSKCEQVAVLERFREHNARRPMMVIEYLRDCKGRQENRRTSCLIPILVTFHL